MNLESAKVVYYSPTGTTKAVVQGVARGLDADAIEFIDITKPSARKRPIEISGNELFIVAVPVYMGRVPALLDEWLSAIKADNTPAVGVVVYGNRAYENALLELRDILKGRGCIPIAGGAYIGEHSFSSAETPTAAGRPDGADLAHAESFGRKIREKLESVSSVDQCPDLAIPGEYPYGGVTELWSVDFILVSDECTQCGICAEACPVGAINPDKSDLIDKEKCITCCACIKICPENARTMKDSPVKDAAMRLNKLYQDRKEPEFFI